MLREATIGRKLVVGLVVAGIFSAAVVALGVYEMGATRDRFQSLVDGRFPAGNALAEFRSGVDAVSRGMNGMLIPEVGANRKSAGDGYKMVEGAFARIEAARAAWRGIGHSQAADEKWNAIEARYAQWEPAARALHDAIKAYHETLYRNTSADAPEVRDARATAMQRWQAMRDAYVAMAGPFADLTTRIRERVQVERADALAATRAAELAFLLGGFCALAALAGLGVFLSRSVRRTTTSLTRETAKLTAAVERGALDVRGDASVVGPEFRCVVEGVNRTMDAFVKPLRVTGEYVSRISNGDLPPRITDAYQGDFDAMKQSLNACIDAVHAMTDDAIALGTAAIEGTLRHRADPAKHRGDYRKIIERVNGTLDAVLGPIDEAAEVLQHLARRDLTARMRGSYRGDHGKIKDALNATAEELHRAIAQVADSARQVSSAADQIASSSQSVASGASEQAASLEETSASLETMAATTKHATDSAHEANGLAGQARAAASDGSSAMDQMTAAMARIKASAEGTSQIIKDINEIAFQTNLLALNAAVEAARAGDAGRGFAVVAEEVRSLALRSKEAANKTEELIRQSVREAGDGEVTAKLVHAKLGEIATSVAKVSDIVGTIASVANEQTVGIDQVHRAVAQMNQVTQANAASSEESSSAATELSSQAEELTSMVATFELGEGRGGAPRRSEPAKRTTPPKATTARAPAKVPAAGPRVVPGAAPRNGAQARPTAAGLIPLDDMTAAAADF